MKHRAMQGLIFVHNDRAGHWPAPRYTKKPELNRAFGNHIEGMADVVSTQCYDYFDAVRMKIESPILVNTSL